VETPAANLPMALAIVGIVVAILAIMIALRLKKKSQKT
jgi:biopolymer transport protein ExbB/TolQ